MVRQTNQKTKTKKKKGRPSLLDLQNRSLLLQQQSQLPKSTLSNPNSQFINPNHHLKRSSGRRFPNSSADNLTDEDDDDDERIEKKVKLVVRLPPFDDQIPKSSSPNSSSFDSSNCDDNGDDLQNAVAEDEKGQKATDTQNALEPGPTSTSTPLPDKKLLLLILDKLQKKDTRGVFAEPVDPEELPDYHEVIENPMDFGTLRKKLDHGLYSILEQLEADIYLICSNAMQYNAPCTIYFRQARSIQELAKKEFETLRQDGGQTEPQPKPRRGRPPGSRNLKKLLESSSLDPPVSEASPDATLASREDDAVRSNSYNLRKGPSLYRFPRSLENCFDFSAPVSKSPPVRHGKKQCGSDENRRETYTPTGQFDSDHDSSLFDTLRGFEKKLIAVGLDSNHSYARSLGQFAAGLGPVVWRIVSKKITSVLPPGVQFGPGWVAETKAPSTQVAPLSSDKSESYRASTSGFTSPTCGNQPSASGKDKSSEAKRASPTSEWSLMEVANGAMEPGPLFHIQRGPLISPRMNGFTGGFGCFDRSASSSFNHPSESTFLNISRGLNSSKTQNWPVDFPGTMNEATDLGTHGIPYWQNLSVQERWDSSYPSDLNVGFHQATGSRGMSLSIASPPQLDLGLQL